MHQPGSADSIDLATMSNADDKDEQPLLMDLVDDSVVTDPDSPLRLPAQLGEPSRARWSGIRFERTEGPDDSPPRIDVKAAELAFRRRGQIHVEPPAGHA